ncbi:aldehyde dehydrogenase family protein (plasmid) [Pseudomonas sp. BYT-5]|uniref:aldehyde dehydrogenase family protein n=1 Tax=Pseudomonas sp. BYT-5 TaxID=2944392 RepID=UPI00201FB868|nr:aldehyde dehydrogenase family protein [Pseudomonas sp. BYT-5]URD45376.1 aldehyde dehydrogenase family protein [Pseudomonas sp. BYT-5]
MMLEQFSYNYACPLRWRTVSVIEPATQQVLVDLQLANIIDVANAAERSAAAQAGWAALPFNHRAKILRKAAELLKEREELFNSWNIRECGSTMTKAAWELEASYEHLHSAAGLAGQPHGTIIPSSTTGRLNLCTRVPVGVVGVITPWNYPLLLAIRSVAPALALGNSVLLKPAIQGSCCGGLLISQLFRDAGMPEDVFQVLPGEADVGDALVRDTNVNMISFTGSTAVGRSIGSICGGLLKKVALELGGNNAFIVLEDADIETAASHGAWGAFLHQGQICMQAGRHLVHASVMEAYANALASHAKALVAGNPYVDNVHLGPLISDQQYQRVNSIVQASIAQGAVMRAGGPGPGLIYNATVLTGISQNMPAFTEEVFGPVAPILPFDTDDELIQIVNSSPYGLAAGIHTANISRGMSIAARIKTGMVHINDQPVNAEHNVPFGGMGASGSGGRFGGPANAEEFTQSQWVSLSAKPGAYPF